MQKRNCITAAVLAVLFALTILTSSIFIIEHAEHDCTGDGCEICEEILICATALKTLSYVSATAIVAVAVKYSLDRLQDEENPGFALRTPVSLRVKLSN